VYYADDIAYFNSRVTDSLFNEITSIDVNFRQDGDGTYTMQNANPGSQMYNVVVDYNGPVSIQIVLPDAEDSAGNPVSPAFDLHSQNPIRVYSDMDRTVDVTSDASITVEGNLITVNITIPSDKVAYVRVHLDYAVEETTGWEFTTGPEEYYQDLPFFVSFISEDQTFGLDLATEFEAFGSG
jgi:hypothetical protein